MSIDIKKLDTKIIINDTSNNPINILFIHGFGGQYSNKNSFYEHFNLYNYYLINLPCHGKSICDINFLDIELFKKIIVSFVLENNLKNVYIMGHSMGGGLAILVAKELIEKNIKINLILETPLNSSVLSGYDIVKKMIPKSYSDMEEVANHLFNEPLSFFKTKNNLDNFIKNEYIRLSNSPLKKIIEFENIKKSSSLVDFTLNQLNCNILLILGENDQIINAKQTLNVFKEYKNKKVFIIKNSKHMPLIESKELCYSIIKKFIGDTSNGHRF